MIKKADIPVLLCASIVFSGCATNSQQKELENKVDNLESRIEDIEDEATEIPSNLTYNYYIDDMSVDEVVNEFPSIADYLENLIALTPTQHFGHAHPNNNTQYISKEYQYLCLISKTGSIRDNILGGKDEPVIYDFYLYQNVLNTGLRTEEFIDIQENDFDGILNCIEKHY